MLKKRNKHRVRFVKAAAFVVIVAAAVCGSLLMALNRLVIDKGSPWIVTADEAAKLSDVDCILVLGAGVYANKYPSDMLEDRLAQGVRLYRLGVSDRLLMSGDNSKVNYNEVKVMKDFAVKSGIPSSNVFQDHAGFSTYESMYRARAVFAAQKIVIVTQSYHMYRALFIARALGLDAWGVVSDPRSYGGQAFREIRELLARPKDVFSCIFKPLPTFLGDVIPVGGDGDVTD
jgi:vancomycin permeability regulator SanA